MVIGKITYNKTVVRGIRGIGYGGTGGVMRGGGVTKEIRGVQGMGNMLQMGGRSGGKRVTNTDKLHVDTLLYNVHFEPQNYVVGQR